MVKVKCEGCKKTLSTVGVESSATQSYDFETGEYNNLEVQETIGYFCNQCGERLGSKQTEELGDMNI